MSILQELDILQSCSVLVLHIFIHSEQPDTTAVTHDVVAEPLRSSLNRCSLLPQL